MVRGLITHGPLREGYELGTSDPTIRVDQISVAHIELWVKHYIHDFSASIVQLGRCGRNHFANIIGSLVQILLPGI